MIENAKLRCASCWKRPRMNGGSPFSTNVLSMWSIPSARSWCWGGTASIFAAKNPSTRRTRFLSGGRRTCGRCVSRTRQATSAISAEKRIYGNIFRGASAPAYRPDGRRNLCQRNPVKNREQLKEITDRIEAGIRDIFESGDMEKYRNYLRTMSRFHNYSLNNQALIHLQRPDATLVAGYNRWRDKFSRHVLRGEKGITIIAPTPYKKKKSSRKSSTRTRSCPFWTRTAKSSPRKRKLKYPCSVR